MQKLGDIESLTGQGFRSRSIAHSSIGSHRDESRRLSRLTPPHHASHEVRDVDCRRPEHATGGPVEPLAVPEYNPHEQERNRTTRNPSRSRAARTARPPASVLSNHPGFTAGVYRAACASYTRTKSSSSPTAYRAVLRRRVCVRKPAGEVCPRHCPRHAPTRRVLPYSFPAPGHLHGAGPGGWCRPRPERFRLRPEGYHMRPLEATCDLSVTVRPCRVRILAMAYHPDDILDERQVAALLHTSVRSLRRWRTEGRGPPFAKVGKNILYRYGGILAWLEGREEREAIAAHERRARWEAKQQKGGHQDRPSE